MLTDQSIQLKAFELLGVRLMPFQIAIVRSMLSDGTLLIRQPGQHGLSPAYKVASALRKDNTILSDPIISMDAHND